MLGVIASGRGEYEAAHRYFQKAVDAEPGNADFLNNLGVSARALGRNDAAVDAFRLALARDPRQIDARCNLGNALLALGEAAAAMSEYLAVLRLEAAHVGARNNLALAYRMLGRPVDAVVIYRQLAAEDPGNPAAHSNLGAAEAEQGNHRQALAHYRQALEIEPDNLEALNNLGVAFLAQGRTKEAESYLRRVLVRDGNSVAALGNLGTVLRRQGRIDDAAQAYRRALSIAPNDGLRVRLATLLPVIGQSEAAMAKAREDMMSAIDALLAREMRIDDPVAEIGVTQFNLSYHDAGNRRINRKIAQLYKSACPALEFVAPHCNAARVKHGGRLKVGFVSAHFRDHAVGWCYHALMRFMPGESISVTAFTFGDGDDDLWRAIVRDVNAAVILPANLAGARERIAQAELDILIYTDIGMEPLTYFLAFSRLAPVQCATNGHPDTTGIPAIDYFVSSAPLEPDDAASHYGETLAALDDVLVHYTRPARPDPLRPRAHYGLPDDATLYLCPQSLFKIHPCVDAALAEILAGDPDGILVIFEGAEEHWTAQLLDRWRGAMGSAMPRVQVLPRQPFDDFINILALVDVMLDTWPFGGGNTTYQGLAMGTPIVTLPGRFARGRSTMALYNRMAITETIAETPGDYVAIALRLGMDAPWRAKLSGAIDAKADILFDDKRAIAAFTEFLISAGAKEICE